jgi:hypothetical protein
MKRLLANRKKCNQQNRRKIMRDHLLKTKQLMHLITVISTIILS